VTFLELWESPPAFNILDKIKIGEGIYEVMAALRDYLTALLEGSVEQIDATGDPGSAAHLPG